jgi:chromosome segregation ATPase
MDFADLKREYVALGKSVKKLSEEWGVDAEELSALAKREGWDALRDELSERESLSEYRVMRLHKVADLLLERLEESISQMDASDLKVYKQLTGSLKDIKDIQSLKSEAVEQKPEGAQSGDVVVRIEGGGTWSR